MLLGHRLQDEGKVEGPGHPGVPRECGGGPSLSAMGWLHSTANTTLVVLKADPLW